MQYSDDADDGEDGDDAADGIVHLHWTQSLFAHYLS